MTSSNDVAISRGKSILSSVKKSKKAKKKEDELWSTFSDKIPMILRRPFPRVSS